MQNEFPRDWRDLEPLYRATTYRVLLPGEWSDVHIGKPLPHVLGAWLEGLNEVHWAIISADNPGSKMLPSSENSRRRQALEAQLAKDGKVYYPTKHMADDGQWPVERGVLVAGLKEAEALSIAQTWGQRGVVIGCIGTVGKQEQRLQPYLLEVPEMVES